MHRISAILSQLLDETRRIDHENNGGTANNPLLVQCRHNDQLVRRMKVSLDAACGRPETAAFWSKFRDISTRYSQVVQGVSLVSLFSKMHSDLVAPTSPMSEVRIPLEECHKYSEARARRLKTRLDEAHDLLIRIGEEAQKVGATELSTLFLTFDEKLRIAALDAEESTEKVAETYSSIHARFNSTVEATNRSVTLVMGAMFGITFGGLLSWFYLLSIIPCIVVAGVVGAFLARFYNSASRDEVSVKQLFLQHRDKHANATQILDRLLEQVKRESSNL